LHLPASNREGGNAIVKSLGFVIWIVAAAYGQEFTQGALRGARVQGGPATDCPLKHTRVTAEISGMLARVNVVQEFQNPLSEPIEAVYTFPLPHDAAVDDMTMIVAGRTIRGSIRTREDARAIYEAARTRGQAASLLHPSPISCRVPTSGSPSATCRISVTRKAISNSSSPWW
jgi:hypothetical protein